MLLVDYICYQYLCVQACKAALQKVGPLMKSDKINAMFQKHCNPEEQLLYAEFLNDLYKLIVSSYHDNTMSLVFSYCSIFVPFHNYIVSVQTTD